MTFYLFGAGAYCTFLVLLMLKEQQNLQAASKEWIVIVIASALWVIVVPISLLEIITKANRVRAKADGRGKSIIAQETL